MVAGWSTAEVVFVDEQGLFPLQLARPLSSFRSGLECLVDLILL
jgi:hypothetical protein